VFSVFCCDYICMYIHVCVCIYLFIAKFIPLWPFLSVPFSWYCGTTISGTFSSSQTEIPHPLKQSLPISPPPSPQQLPFYFLWLWFDCSRYFVHTVSMHVLLWLADFTLQLQDILRFLSTLRPFLSFFFFVFLLFLGPLPRHMEVPKLGVESELWPLAYTRGGSELRLRPTPQLTATPDR